MHGQRTFSKFYLQKERRGYFLPETLGVKTKGFSRLEKNVYEFTIASPSVIGGERRYLFPFTRTDATTPERINKHYQGLIGEQVLRICLTEMLRRRADDLSIAEYAFSKGNFHPKNSTPYTQKNHAVRLRHLSRYNVAVEDLEGRTLAEYDGILEYTPGNALPKGRLVCESKTGTLGILRGANSPRGREHISQRIINPLQSLFPQIQKDLVLMATPEYLYKTGGRRKIIHDSVATLSSFLADNEIGLVAFEFPVSKTTIRRVANEISAIRKGLFSEGKPIEERIDEFPDQTYILTDDGLLRLIKKRRVEKILQTTDKANWVTVYSIEESDENLKKHH